QRDRQSAAGQQKQWHGQMTGAYGTWEEIWIVEA
ncbi:MAG: hypothetical protein ACI87E_001668, partial [Mariniblastus sp.]